MSDLQDENMGLASLHGPPASDATDGKQPPAMGIAWAYSAYIPVPPEVGTLSTPSDHSDHVNLVKNTITQSPPPPVRGGGNLKQN